MLLNLLLIWSLPTRISPPSNKLLKRVDSFTITRSSLFVISVRLFFFCYGRLADATMYSFIEYWRGRQVCHLSLSVE